MKKSIILSSLALISAIAFVGCNKEIAPEPSNETVVRFTINAAAPETKTYIEYNSLAGTYTPNWHNGDELGVFFNSWAENAALSTTFANTSANGPSASFSGEGTVNASQQTIYAFYPSSAFAKAYADHVIGLTIPGTQKPTASSFDKAADLLVNKPYPITISNTSVVIDDMQFKRILSTLKLVIADGTGESILASDKIKSVTLTTKTSADANGEALTGRYQWDFENETGLIVDNVKTNAVTADLSANPVELNGSNPIYLMVNPTTLPKDSKLIIDISTDKHEISKTATLSTKAFEFPAGQVARLNISIKDTDTIDDALVEPTGTGWYQVKDASWLKAGDKVVITNATPDKAMGSQGTNNWSSVEVSETDGKLNVGSAAQFTLATGSQDGAFAFKIGDNYLNSENDSKNYLKSDATSVTDASSWYITVTKTSTTIFNIDLSAREIQYNPTNNPTIFSCYKSTQQSILIYKYYDGVDTRAESGIEWDEADGMGDVLNQELALPNLVNPNSLAVAYSSSDETVATILSDAHTVTLLKAGVTQIHAVFAGNATYKPADVYYTLTVDDSRTAVTLSFTDASYALTIGSADYDNFTGQTVTANPSVPVIYALTGAAVGTLNGSTGAITLDDSTTGTATVTASFAGNATHKPAEDASYTIVVSVNGTPGDESFDLTTNTYTTGTDLVTWTGESVVITNSGTNATNYLGGDASNRTSSRFYNGNTLTIAPNSDYTITSIVFTATSTNYAGVLGNNSTWTNATASVNGAEVTVTPTNGSNNVSAAVSGTCGFTTIVINYVFSGVVVPKYAITIDNNIANGSVSADLSEAAEGATVTLTATPASAYALDSWNVYKTGESGTKVTVTSNTFTMPGYAVTVSASFAPTPTISMNTTSITGVAAAGVTTTEDNAYNLLNGAANADVTITCDGTVVTAASKNATAGSIDYTVSANSAGARDGWIKVQYNSDDPHQITVSQLSGGVLTYSMTIDSATGTNGTCDVTWKDANTTSVSYNGITWSTTVEGSPAFQGSNNDCKIGSKNNPATKITISTTGFGGKKIVEARLKGYCTSNTGPTLTITAGSTTMLNAASIVKTTSTVYTSTTNNVNLASGGALTFEINSAAAAGIVIAWIEVDYTD